MRHTLLLTAFVATAWIAVHAQGPAGAAAPASRVVHTDPAKYRESPAVHGGAGSMSFTRLLGAGAVTPEFNFLDRGVIPPGAGIGHHFHNVVEEMFVILDGEAQFTIDGRTAAVKGPAGVICRTGHAHAIYNASSTPLQWMNLNVSLIPGVYDNFDTGDTRAGAALDAIPTFMTMRLDKALLRPAGAGARGRGAAPTPPAPNAVLSRRVLGPAVFSTTWSYIDHVVVPPGASTSEAGHDTVGELYYVLGGAGTISLKGETAPIAIGDAIPVRVGESTHVTNTGTAPLELFVMGVARDMTAKTQLLAGPPRN